TFAWVGDGNIVATSWMHAGARFGIRLRMASPAQLRPGRQVVDWVASVGAEVTVTDDPQEAVSGASSVVTDTWVSMRHTDASRRKQILGPYSVDCDLMHKAS